MKDVDFTATELEAVQEFINEEIDEKSEEHLKFLYSQLFKDIKSPKLKK